VRQAVIDAHQSYIESYCDVLFNTDTHEYEAIMFWNRLIMRRRLKIERLKA
jgi:hypothetical protein